MTDYDPWPNETDEQRRCRYRQTEWYLIEFTASKLGSFETKTYSVKMADNLGLALEGYCELKGLNTDTVDIINQEYLGREH